MRSDRIQIGILCLWFPFIFAIGRWMDLNKAIDTPYLAVLFFLMVPIAPMLGAFMIGGIFEEKETDTDNQKEGEK
jgi:hypothetical protein